MSRLLRGVMLFGFGLGAPAVQAQSATDDAWTFRVAPYLWGSSSEGHFAHARLPLDIHLSKSFSDTLEELDLGAMGMFEARKGRHGLLVDGQYAKLSSSVPVPVPMVGATLPVQLKTRMVSGLFAYRHGWIENETTQVDLVAGVRVWSARVRVAYAVPVPTPPPIPQQYAGEQSQRWADLQVGVKGRRAFSNGLFVGGWALVGTGESDLSTDLMLLAGYDLNERMSMVAGYRRLSTDYETSGGFRFDNTMQGPGLGLEYRF